VGKYEDIVKEEYDSFPDVDVLKDFDDFLVGGTQKFTPGFAASQRSLAWQLLPGADVSVLRGMFKNGDPAPAAPEDLVEARDDLLVHAPDQVDLDDPAQYKRLFIEMKQRAFGIFDFLEIMSASLGDVPVKEQDLILSDYDLYTLDYLQGLVTDYFALASIATLAAYENMGIYSVKFRQLDGCPVCRATDGLIYSTKTLLNLFGSGSHITHPYCDSNFLPVVSREMYSGLLTGHLNLEEIIQGGVRVLNVPRELEGEIRGLVEGTDFDHIEFVDMKDHLFEDMEVDRLGVVAIVQDDVLYVHNSYVGLCGPAEFLREFLHGVSGVTTVSPSSLAGADSYFLGGRRVVHKDGFYWDPDTGQKVK
jgi:hypothetical protein